MNNNKSNPEMPSFIIASAYDDEQKARDATRVGLLAGAKNAVIVGVATAVPMVAARRYFPGAKAFLNYNSQAILISGASLAAFAIGVDKTILKTARGNAKYDKSN